MEKWGLSREALNDGLMGSLSRIWLISCLVSGSAPFLFCHVWKQPEVLNRSQSDVRIFMLLDFQPSGHESQMNLLLFLLFLFLLLSSSSFSFSSFFLLLWLLCSTNREPGLRQKRLTQLRQNPNAFVLSIQHSSLSMPIVPKVGFSNESSWSP